jgi:2-haloacid dehalogenase
MPTSSLADIEACVFDAYGTLFDVHSAAARCRHLLGDKADKMSEIWRVKQLQYSWLRSLMRRHVDFWQITADALDYAMESVGLDAPDTRERLLQVYRELDAYPEVPSVLGRLKDAGLQTAILSNGAPDMLASAVDNAGLADRLDAVLSVEDVGIFKPAPEVYQLAVDRLGVAAERICFMSSNAWDVCGAAAFGFRVVWVNRFGQPAERLPGEPVAQLSSLEPLPALLGATA